MSDKELEALALAIAQRVRPRKAPLTLIPQAPRPERFLDEIDRESRLRWLKALRRALKYMHVELFFEQALVGKAALDDLSDEEIIDLHRMIDKARDHYHNSDGVSYYEAGLLRSHGEVA